METLFYLISNLFHIYAIFQCALVLFPKRKTGLFPEILCYLGYYMVNSSLFLLFHHPVLNIITNLIPFWLITLLYQTTWSKRFFATIAIYVIGMIADIACTFISLLFPSPPIFFSTGFVSSLIFILISRILQGARIFRHDNNTKLQQIYTCITLLVPVASIFIGHFSCNTLSMHSFITAILLLIINISIFSLYDLLLKMLEEQHTTELIRKQNQAYQSQLKLIQQSEMHLRCLRHDMNNHVRQMQYFIHAGMITELQEYLNATKSYLHTDNWVSYSSNEMINSILNYKLMPLRRSGAKLDIQVCIQDPFPFNTFDCNVILSNLLDNAVEASERMPSYIQRHIVLTMRQEKGILRICIGNRFDGIIDQKLGTRKKDFTNHGIGLKSVASIVEKYQGIVQTSTNQNWFEVMLLLYEILSP